MFNKIMFCMIWLQFLLSWAIPLLALPPYIWDNQDKLLFQTAQILLLLLLLLLPLLLHLGEVSCIGTGVILLTQLSSWGQPCREQDGEQGTLQKGWGTGSTSQGQEDRPRVTWVFWICDNTISLLRPIPCQRSQKKYQYIFQSWSALWGFPPRLARHVPVSRNSPSTNCSSWGLLPPVLLLQVVPPIQPGNTWPSCCRPPGCQTVTWGHHILHIVLLWCDLPLPSQIHSDTSN